MSEEIKRQQCIASAQKERNRRPGSPCGQKMSNMSTVTNLVAANYLVMSAENPHLSKSKTTLFPIGSIKWTP
ncbi:hypothetical protein [Collinsella sp. BIOML-A5]|uniref:hypothetical protein n=1 Tax=Collinsella sp. BIOML-A5 TaxID=2584632 RepID=UPI00136EB329|nr:hypothetical protein [Collinsella sp. BIOML-A5]